MREIKFRGKREDNGEWVYGMPFIFPDTCTFVSPSPKGTLEFYYQIDLKTIGQFTGLLDIHGKEIFEGDVLVESDNNIAIGAVEFIDAAFQIKLQCRVDAYGWNKSKPAKLKGANLGQYILTDRMFYKPEVVGNICDNPELIQEVAV